ncbi:4-hydroxy-3-methylbut-2-enyl diphosphate reductase, partial [bacterium]
MQIFIAKSAGFCFGVKRAINMAEKCAEETHSPIYTLGPIIHNPQAVKRLEESNVYAKKGLDEISEGTVIIRSHGAKLEEHKAAR